MGLVVGRGLQENSEDCFGACRTVGRYWCRIPLGHFSLRTIQLYLLLTVNHQKGYMFPKEGFLFLRRPTDMMRQQDRLIINLCHEQSVSRA